MDFQSIFDDVANSLSSFGNLGTGGVTVPTDSNDILNMTVGDYLDLLDNVQQVLTSLSPVLFQQILNNPFVADQLDAEARTFLEAWAQGDFSGITGPFDEVRAAMAQFPRSTLLRDAIDQLDGTGNTTAEIDQLFADARGRLQDDGWLDQDGNFISPLLNVDFTTGIWSTIDTTIQGFNGTTLDALYSALGQAFSDAVADALSGNQSLLDALAQSGVSSQDIANLPNVAGPLAAAAFKTLQDFGEAVEAGTATLSPIALQAAAASQVKALVDAIQAAYPGLEQELSSLIFGSQNSNPNFLIDFDGSTTGTDRGDWLYLTDNADTFASAAGQDILFGLAGADTLDGGDDADVLIGGDDNDSLSGGNDNDSLAGGAGDDIIDGGAGEDTAFFDADMGRYTFELNADGSIKAVDRAPGGDGIDTLTNVETLAFTSGAGIFDDGTAELSVIQGITGLSQDQIDTFIELYIAYFNRAPDAPGLYFWGSAFANGTDLETIAALFLDQDETRLLYPSDATNLDFATQVYSNVLGRTPDQGGLNFWVSQLDQGNVGRDTFILEVLKGAKVPQTDADPDILALQQGDQEYLANKTDIGTYFAVIKGLSNVRDANEAMQLYARGDDSTIDLAVARIDADHLDATAVDSGELLLQLVGVADDPFLIA